MSKSQEISLADRTVPQAFSSVAKRFSERPAVLCGDDSMSYGELELRSDALADLLRDKGVRPGDLVGVCTERRVELPVALLAILKAGAGYVPLDSAYPDRRLIEVADDANFRFLLGRHPVLQSRFDSLGFDGFPGERIKSNHDDDLELGSESVAYVMFTSGSTGRPKGVAVPHRGILRLVQEQDYCELGPGERILQHSPVAFDASTFEIWGALLNGGQLVIFDEDELSLRGLGKALVRHEITTVWLTAGLFHAMVDERCEDLAGLKQLLTGGDVVSPIQAESLLRRFPDIRLINGYGPTENTTFTCCHQITLADVSNGKAIPIGKPIRGTSVFILGEDLNPVEPGQPGELCAGGDGVAIGYWNCPESTESRFVFPEWDRSVRLYRTGDLACQRPDGTCEFLGRMDQQVKIRGYRIEMGEIETALHDLDGIQQAVVIARPRGEGADKVIVAYYVSDAEIDPDESRDRLKKSLPHYAIPNFFHRVNEMPLTPNGKVDRKALPEPSQMGGGEESGSRGSSFRSRIREIFATVLDMPEIPLRTNFFDLGISSLQLARVHEKTQAEMGIEFPITDFFQYSTIDAFAGFIEKKRRPDPARSRAHRRELGEEHIAIVGMAGRFPGAPDVDAFWQNLIEGRETISHFSAEELDFENATAAGADPEDLYVRARGIVEGSDQFDARHFGISPREAEELDPQHRLLLECAQTALENAGHDPDRYDGKIGIFCGASQNSYLLNNLCGNSETSRRLAAGYPTSNLNVILGNDKDFLPTRIAYKLNLRGPAVSVQCACSTSLVSVAQACESIGAGRCDVALAGGISLGYPQKRDYLYTPDGIYNSIRSGEKPVLHLAKQYAEHSGEMLAFRRSASYGEQKAFWLDAYSELPPAIDLPLDRPHQAERSFGGATIEHRIGRDVYEAVKLAGARKGSTLYGTLLATYQLLMHRLSGQDDLVVCIPSAGQNDGANTDSLVGHCVNFLPLRSRYSDAEQFDEFLARSRGTLLAATDNRTFTYGELISSLEIERDPRRMPLLEVAFNVERMDYFGEWDDLEVVFEPNGKTHVHYTFFMNIVESANGLLINVDYNTDVLDEGTVFRWVDYFENLLLEVIEGDAGGAISGMKLMPETELRKLVETWNSHDSGGPHPAKPVHRLFEEQVAVYPDSAALLFGDETISYRRLNAQANAVARELRQRGIGRGDFVALLAHRSPEVVAGLMGILKAGAAYVPIDPAYPEERIQIILEDAGAGLLLVSSGIDDSAVSGIEGVSIPEVIASDSGDAFTSAEAAMDDPAYLMYTSGSTGKPKGAIIPHRGIVRLVKNNSYIKFDRSETFLLSAPISFDASTLEIFGPLLNGGKAGLIEEPTPGLKEIGDAIRHYRVTTLWLTSALFSLMIDERPDDLRGVRQLLAGGDVLSKRHVEQVEWLYLFDTNNPVNEEQYWNDHARWLREEWALLEGPDLLSRLAQAGGQFYSKLQFKASLVYAKLASQCLGLMQRDLPDELRMDWINKQHDILMRDYRPRPYPGRTCLFSAKSTRFAFDREMGWSGLIENLEVRDIPGNHRQIFSMPYVESFISRFNELHE